MALTPNNLFQRVADILQDAGNVRWSSAELLRYLNDGRRELAIYRPDIYSETASLTLAAGTKQTIPSDGNKFMDAVRNIKSDDTSGNAVRIIEREVLDSQQPDWHTTTSSITIQHFMFDERSPRTFYVYPPATGSGHKLEIVYGKSPVEITSSDLDSTSVLAKEDIYVGALTDYVLFKAFSKDSEYSGNIQRANAAYQLFAYAIGIGNRKLYVNSPNVVSMGGVAPTQAQADS